MQGAFSFERSSFRFDPAATNGSVSASAQSTAQSTQSVSSHTFQLDFIAHAACWRPALAASIARWPSLWVPVEPEALGAIEGLGSYSWSTDSLTDPKWQAMGYGLNWDLSGRFFPCVRSFPRPSGGCVGGVAVRR